MKVLISYLFCTKGGVETALYNRLKEINRNHLEVDLHFFKDYGGTSIFKDYTEDVIIQADPELIQKKIIENAYDVVISIDSVNMLQILQNMRFKGKIGLEIHTTYEKSLQYLDNNLINIVDFVIVPSEYQKAFIQNKISTKKIYVLGNAVSKEFTYKKGNGVENDKKIILWVGRIDSHKNWRLFLSIAKELHKINQRYLFWVVGGLKSEQSEINAFESMIYEYGLECVVRWIPQVPYDRMSEIYSYVANNGGCYISTSLNESFGMTIIEAMACKCPVIVNETGALPELVDNGRGLCLKDMDMPRQIEKIYHFIEDLSKDNLIKNAQTFVKEKFSSETIGREFVEIIMRETGCYKDEKRTKISIFGSCCSRDVFEYDTSKTLLPCVYIARQSIVSSVSDAVPISMSQIALDSSFQKKQIFSDFNKTAFEQLKKAEGSWLLIDLTEERFDLAKIGSGIVTNSDELQSIKAFDEKKTVLKKIGRGKDYYVEGISIREIAAKWCKHILEIFPCHGIILHKVYCAEKYFDKNKQLMEFDHVMLSWIRNVNQLYKYMYDCIESELYGCFVIDISGNFFADENHKWGLEPFHFQEEYYKEVLNQIMTITKTGDNVG